MRIELIWPYREDQSKRSSKVYDAYFATVYRTSDTLGIFAIMSLGKVYYDPKHLTGFGSVAKLVTAGKIKNCFGRLAVRSEHLHFAQTCT
jgi:hypothetical protein